MTPPILTTTPLRAAWAPPCEGPWTRIELHGEGAISVRPATADAWRALNAILVAHDYRTRRADTGAFNCRRITNGKGYSLHAYGIAADLNWTTNPYGPRLVTDMPAAMVVEILALRTVSGHQVFGWGGNYRTNKDAMHYEIVCTPAQLATGLAGKDAPGPARPAVVPAWHSFAAGATDETIRRSGGLGHQVSEVQLMLTALGYDVGKVDGAYGPRTQAAVRAFKRWVQGIQRAKGGTVWPNDDTNVGPHTIAMLRWWNKAKA